MQISFSTTGIFDLDRPKKYIDYISDAGFDSLMLDLSVFCRTYDLENFGKDKRGDKVRIRKENGQMDVMKVCHQMEQLTGLCCNRAIDFALTRTPRLGWQTKRTDLNALLLQIGKDCIELCGKIGCGKLIVQPLFSGIGKSGLQQENYRYYSELGAFAQKRKVRILLENQCNSINGHFVRGICADAFTASKWIDAFNEEVGGEVFGFCLDTGAANLCGQNMREMAAALGKRLNAVLIRECDGINDASRLPFSGADEKGSSTDWIGLIRGLRNINFDGILVMDAESTLRGFSHLLRSQLYPFVKSTADFLKWQIEMEQHLKRYSSRVLFGAGKMCQNYMACYGEEYPPLFACDNNADLWGTVCSGLEVKSPENLKKLPDDCAVIICNIYYEEIAKQLRKMGIKNIETFNDEYLPVLQERER